MTEVVKKQSFALANILSKFGIRIQHSVALEVMAQLNGAKDWNIFAAQGKSVQSLTDAHKSLLDASLRLLTDTPRGSQSEGEVLCLACAGDVTGALLHMTRFNPSHQWEIDAAYTRLGIEDLESWASERAVFLFVKLVSKAGAWVVTESLPVSKAELHNHTVTLSLDYLPAYSRVACPLTGFAHKLGHATVPFVEGSIYPVFEFIVPQRVWDIAHAIDEKFPDGAAKGEQVVRMVVTVGEMAACYKQSLEEGLF